MKLKDILGKTIAVMAVAVAFTLGASSVFATTYISEGTEADGATALTGLSYSQTDNSTVDSTITSTWTFAGNSSKPTIAAGDVLEGIVVTGSGSKTFSTSNYFSLSKTMGMNIPVSENMVSGTLYITCTGTDSSRYLQLLDADGNVVSDRTIAYSKSDDQKFAFTSSDAVDGYLKFQNYNDGTTSTSDYKMSKIQLVETVNTASYTISGTFTDSRTNKSGSVTLTIGGEAVTVGDGGAFSVSLPAKVSNAVEVSYAEGDTEGTLKTYVNDTLVSAIDNSEGDVSNVKIELTDLEKNTISGTFTDSRTDKSSDAGLTIGGETVTVNNDGTFSIGLAASASNAVAVTADGILTTTVSGTDTNNIIDNTAGAVSNVVITLEDYPSINAAVKYNDGNSVNLSDTTINYKADGASDYTEYTPSGDTIQISFKESLDLYVKINDYWTKHVSYTASSTDDIVLSPVTVTQTNDNKFTISNFAKPDDYAGDDSTVRTSISGTYNVNGYTITGGSGANIDFSNNRLQAAVNDDSDEGGTIISYTPTANGVLAYDIDPAGSVSTDKTRGFKVTEDGTELASVDFESSSKVDPFEYNVTKGKTYKLIVKGTAMSNLTSIEFTPDPTPTLELVSFADRVASVKINNVDANNPISKIAVMNGDSELGTVTRIGVDDLDNPTEFTFSINFTGSNTDFSNVKIVMTYGDDSDTSEISLA